MSRQPFPLARTSGLVVQRAGDETIVYDTATDKAYVLSPAAAAVWNACNGQRSVPAIAEFLSQTTRTGERTVWYALSQLNELLEEPVALPAEYMGMSRRRFLKMSGAVAAGVAIPLVVKMVAPTAAQAQSGGPVCCVCSIGSGEGSVGVKPTCADCPAACDAAGGTFSKCESVEAC